MLTHSSNKPCAESGDSMLTVLIAVGIVGILGMVLMSMFRGATDVNSILKQQVDASMLKQQVGTMLANPTVCSESFSDIAFDADNAFTLKRSGTNLLKVGDTFGSLKISKISINAPTPTANLSFATITVEATKTGTFQGSGTVSVKLYSNLLTTDAGTIASCSFADDVKSVKTVNIVSQNAAPINPKDGYPRKDAAGNGSWEVGHLDIKAKGNYIRLTANGILQAISAGPGTAVGKLSFVFYDTSEEAPALHSGPIWCAIVIASGSKDITFCPLMSGPTAVIPEHTYRVRVDFRADNAGTGGSTSPGNLALQLEDLQLPPQ